MDDLPVLSLVSSVNPAIRFASNDFCTAGKSFPNNASGPVELTIALGNNVKPPPARFCDPGHTPVLLNCASSLRCLCATSFLTTNSPSSTLIVLSSIAAVAVPPISPPEAKPWNPSAPAIIVDGLKSILELVTISITRATASHAASNKITCNDIPTIAADNPFIAVAEHDTASAVVAVPAEDENFVYLSSGTWSLMGIETKNPIITEESYRLNFTNEGGVEGTTRFLKNITGMWLLERCREEWSLEGKTYSYAEIVEMAESVKSFQSLIDPDDNIFSNPESMTQAITLYCSKTGQKVPVTHAEFIRCIFESLALKYRYVLNSLQILSPFPINRLHVIGGGSQNKLLNQLTANAIGVPVVAGPAEATAIGNIMMQAKGLGLVSSLNEIRSIIRNSVDLEFFNPQDAASWQSAYDKFLNIIEK